MSEAESINDVAALTVQLLSAYLANNAVASEDLAGLIRSTRDALTAEQAEVPQAEPETATPAVSVRKSLASPEHIISLIDGKPYKTLKRHLKARGLTPSEYRSRYNLPAGYPMVAPAYAEQRRAVAQRTGLGGRKPTAGETPTSKDDQLDAVAAVDLQVSPPQPASKPESKQRGATAAKKRAGVRAAKTDAPSEEASSGTASELTPAAQVDSSSETPTSKEGQIAQSEVAAPSKAVTRPAAKKRTAKSASSDAPQTVRGGTKTKAASGAATTTETTPEAPGPAADEQNAQVPAQTPKRRAKLGVFKKSDA
jgi:predicted transcriptional regulator